MLPPRAPTDALRGKEAFLNPNLIDEKKKIPTNRVARTLKGMDGRIRQIEDRLNATHDGRMKRIDEIAVQIAALSQKESELEALVATLRAQGDRLDA